MSDLQRTKWNCDKYSFRPLFSSNAVPLIIILIPLISERQASKSWKLSKMQYSVGYWEALDRKVLTLHPTPFSYSAFVSGFTLLSSKC
jgi:hypothetical protein